MLAILFLTFFLTCGYLIAKRLLTCDNFLTHLWLGLILGLVGAMWCVIPFAFFLNFSPTAHAFAPILMLIITLSILGTTPERTQPLVGEKIPLTVYLTIGGWTLLIISMLVLHTFLPKNGGLFAGPSTYGDLGWHGSVIHNIAFEQAFPPENPLFAGLKLTYPFLINSLSASLLILGLPLQGALLLPSFILAFLLVTGFMLLTKAAVGRWASAIIASFLFFLNGGFGFAFFVDQIRKDPALWQKLTSLSNPNVTPNYYDNGNITTFWNVFCGLLIPQRTTLVGWTILFCVLWLLYRALTRQDLKLFIIAAILTGLLPMIHTASFLVLLFASLIWFAVFLASSQERLALLKGILLFCAIVLLLAAPQLLFWTSPVTSKNLTPHFLFNAINENKDLWIWFWIKNVGIVFLFAFPAMITASKDRWRFYSAGLALFILAECFMFAIWHPDNNKIYFIWIALTTMVVADYLVDLFGRLKGLRGRWVLAALILWAGLFSGSLSVIHGIRTSFQVASKEDLAVADFIKEKTPPDAIFLAGDNHNSPINMLAGRKLVCGFGGVLWSHGINYLARQNDVKTMFTKPDQFQQLSDQYKVSYVYISHNERHTFHPDEAFFQKTYTKVFSQNGTNIYRVADR